MQPLQEQPSVPIASMPDRRDLPTRGAERAKQMQGSFVNVVFLAVWFLPDLSRMGGEGGVLARLKMSSVKASVRLRATA